MRAAAAASAGHNRGCHQAGFEAATTETIGIFKPHPSVYQLAVDRLGAAAARVCFVSSNGWDIAGAAQFGFRAIWINRGREPRERLPTGPEIELGDLSELPQRVDRTRG